VSKEATMMGYYGSGWNGWAVVMMLAWPVLLGLAVWAVVVLTRDRRSERPASSTPREILDARFASGELSEEDYVRSRHLLNNDAIESMLPEQDRRKT